MLLYDIFCDQIRNFFSVITRSSPQLKYFHHIHFIHAYIKSGQLLAGRARPSIQQTADVRLGFFTESQGLCYTYTHTVINDLQYFSCLPWGMYRFETLDSRSSLCC